MSKKPVWVSPTESGQWKVQREGAERASGIHETQRSAMEQGRGIAKNERTELIVQGANGRIREKDSFGNDPKKTKG
ncbi:DUF2188 domain-containing protein [Corallococcus exiguus]|uniref:DUF2188 domain-containing protein n=1 Tax=Corallococcus exiguus TaxID=83462 RepID=UPI001494164F|nr:DUF2188 domain-containing protein [Corallococcus exiguus]NPD27392.1 DUF2188 domain-containing protein [Corallococcus exiguus]